MSSHANCTHEKTKAARAACRKGLAPTDVDRASRQSQLAAKLNAEKKSVESEHMAVRYGTKKGEPGSSAKLYMSGHCSTGNHDKCIGIYALTPCTCNCHSDLAH